MLELQIVLPGAGELGVTPPLVPPDAFAFVQVRTAEIPFGQDWRSAEDPAATPLRAVTNPTREPDTHISVVTEDASLDVHLRIRYCRSPSCNQLGDDTAPQLCVRIEHPFYIGHRTELELTPGEGGLPLFGNCEGEPAAVGRCQVRGCVAGDETTDYCRSGDGRHLCEG